jgi:hypothetical protein
MPFDAFLLARVQQPNPGKLIAKNLIFQWEIISGQAVKLMILPDFQVSMDHG